MKIKQTVIYLVLGLLLLPAVFFLLFFEGGVIAAFIAVLFLVVSLIFLFISTKRIFTKDLLRSAWFWASLFAAILVLIAMIMIYL